MVIEIFDDDTSWDRLAGVFDPEGPTNLSREEAIARLMTRASGPDADVVEPGHTLTIRQRASRVEKLLDRVRRRLEGVRAW